MPYTPMQLAEVFLKTGELDDALEALNQQLEDAPADDTARRLRVQILMRQQSTSELQSALADMKQLVEQSAQDYLTLSIIYERLHELSQAIEAIQQARQIDTESAQYVERLLELYLKAEQYDTALDLVRQQERTWRWLEREGDLLAIIGNDTLAIARYGLVLSHLEAFTETMQADYLNALRVRVILARAHAYRRLEYIDIAREHYLDAKKIVPDDSSIDFNLGLLASLEGNLDDAVRLCQTALDHAPQSMRESMLVSIKDNPTYHELHENLAGK